MTARLRGSLGRALGGQTSDSLRTSFVASTSGTLLLSVGGTVWSFLAVVLLARVLGGPGYGVYAYALAWSSILVVPAGLGLSQLAVREVAQYEARERPDLVKGLLRGSYRAVLVAAVAVAAAAAGVVALGVGAGDTRLTVLVALLLVPLVSAYRLAEGVMRGFRRVVEGRVAETTVQPLLLIGLVSVVAAAGDGGITPVGAMGLTVAAAAAAASVGQWLLHRAVPDGVRAAEPEYRTGAWWASARPLLFLHGAQTLHAQIGTILVGALGTATETGAFNVAVRCATFVAFFQMVVNFPLAPSVSRLRARADRDRLQRLVSGAAVAVTVAAVPVAVAFVVLRHPVLRVFDPAFTTAGTALVILVAGELVNVATGAVGVSLTMTGHERLVAGAVSAAVVVNTVVGVVLIPWVGLEGAAIARAVSVAALNVGLALVLWRRERIWAPVLGRLLVAAGDGRS